MTQPKRPYPTPYSRKRASQCTLRRRRAKPRNATTRCCTVSPRSSWYVPQPRQPLVPSLLLQLRGYVYSEKGAPKAAVIQYESMITDPSVQNPLSWTSPDFSLASYDLVFLPGGHEKGVRQIIDSEIIHAHLALYFPLTLKPSPKTVGAICHGVQVLAASKITSPDGKVTGQSVLHDTTTTALPGMMESSIFWMTRLWLGDYYKTYGAGTANVETVVRGVLDDAGSQYRSSLRPSP
jgi:putative intracellular protease/amidase